MDRPPQLRAFLTGNIIHLSVATAAIIVLVLGLVLGQQAWLAYRSVEQFGRVQAAVDAILKATDAQARERGLTAARLSAGVAVGAAIPGLADIRTEVDAAWARVRERIGSIPTLRARSGPIRLRLDRLEAALDRVAGLRGRVDARLTGMGGPVDLADWVDATSQLNILAAALRQELMLAADAPAEVMRLNFLVNSHAAEVAEYAGRFRALLAYHTAAGLPMRAAGLEQARFAHRLARHHLAQLLTAAEPVKTDAATAKVLADIESHRPMLLDTASTMLAAAETGDYPLDVGQWWSQSTAFINRVFMLADRVSAQALSRLRAEARHYGLVLIVYLLLVVVAAMLAALSLARVRQDAERVFVEKEMSETVLASIGDAVVATEADGRVRYLNPVAVELTGWPLHEAFGRHYSEVFRVYNRLHSSDADPVNACLGRGRIQVLTEGHVMVTRDGSEVPIDDSCAPIRDSQGHVVGAVVVFASKTRLQHADGILSYHASHDPLTGLHNRRAFEQILHELLEDVGRNAGEHVLAFIDLDNFKVVNDTVGHAAGDQMLRQLAFLMRRQVRESDVLARFGGDEFALLLRHCDVDQALQVTEKLREVVRNLRFPWEGKAFQTGLSIGLVSVASENVDVGAEGLIREADTACYAAKEMGRNHIHVYRPDDRRLIERQGHMEWVARLSQALDENSFELYCQEIRPLKSRLLPHSELLLRLRDDAGVLVSPGAFIPAAERHGIMPDIDQWVIENACRLVAPRLREGRGGVLNINLSGTTMSDPDSAERIAETVGRHAVSPKRICFEITETAAVSSLDTAVATMDQLRGLGFRFALDDFGSGLSSLYYLKELPVDMVKIDGRFIRNLHEDPVAAAMVEAIGNIARIMKIQTCAEFVENAAILTELERFGIDYAQGYYFNRPCPLDACQYVGDVGTG